MLVHFGERRHFPRETGRAGIDLFPCFAGAVGQFFRVCGECAGGTRRDGCLDLAAQSAEFCLFRRSLVFKFAAHAVEFVRLGKRLFAFRELEAGATQCRVGVGDGASATLHPVALALLFNAVAGNLIVGEILHFNEPRLNPGIVFRVVGRQLFGYVGGAFIPRGVNAEELLPEFLGESGGGEPGHAVKETVGVLRLLGAERALDAQAHAVVCFESQ